jgi:hypothetical protein
VGDTVRETVRETRWETAPAAQRLQRVGVVGQPVQRHTAADDAGGEGHRHVAQWRQSKPRGYKMRPIFTPLSCVPHPSCNVLRLESRVKLLLSCCPVGLNVAGTWS